MDDDAEGAAAAAAGVGDFVALPCGDVLVLPLVAAARSAALRRRDRKSMAR